jgi:hypothetical protein
MYPECRHVRPSGEGCRAAALQGSHWCYFHARMHSRQAQRHAERDLLQSIRRDTARRQHRQPNGRFAPALALPSHPSLDARPGQSSRPQTLTELSSRPERSDYATETGTETYDYGALPVGSGHRDQPTPNTHGSASAEARASTSRPSRTPRPSNSLSSKSCRRWPRISSTPNALVFSSTACRSPQPMRSTARSRATASVPSPTPKTAYLSLRRNTATTSKT